MTQHRPSRQQIKAERTAAKWAFADIIGSNEGEAFGAVGRLSHVAVATSAVVVRRALLLDFADGFPSHAARCDRLRAFLSADRDDRASFVGAALIWGKAAIGSSEPDPAPLLQDDLAQFKPVIDGFAKCAVVTGAQRGQAGVRSVALTFNGALERRLFGESRTLMEAGGADGQQKPQGTLFETTDENLARRLAAGINGILGGRALPIALGIPESQDVTQQRAA